MRQAPDGVRLEGGGCRGGWHVPDGATNCQDACATYLFTAGPDFRVLTRKARKSAQAYYRVYREVIPVNMLVRCPPSIACMDPSAVAGADAVHIKPRPSHVLLSLHPPLPAPTLSRAHVQVRELAAVMQEFTQRGGVRPFGVSLLLAGFDHNGPQLYQIDPSGTMTPPLGRVHAPVF